MELKEMIKVMQHYVNGGEVEFSDDNFETVLGEYNKEDDGDLCWNWEEFDYRIKEQKQKVTIEKWLVKDTDGVYRIIETSMADKLYFEKIKLLETYEVEL